MSDNAFLSSYIKMPTRYVMPSFPDEPPLRPDEEVYQMIAQRYSPDEWNDHSDNFKWGVIEAMNQIRDQKSRDAYRTRTPLTERAPQMERTLKVLDSRKRRLQGLYGSAPGALPFQDPEGPRGRPR